MSDLTQFQTEVRAWLEDNCPDAMRTPMTEAETVWGGRGETFTNPDSKIWLERMAERGWTCPTWPKEYGGGGLNADENRILDALREWSGAAKMALSSIRPERISSDRGLQEMIFTVAGRGSLDSVARFLWQVETAALPVKIKDMQLGSSSEAGDSMSLQLHLSALYLGANKKQAEAENEKAM